MRIAAMEPARVVVEREDEAGFVDGALARRPHHEPSVHELLRCRPAALRKARLPGCSAAGQPKRVGASRPQYRFDHPGTLLLGSDRWG